MYLVSWNVNGIRAVFKKDFIQNMSHLEPDIICLQETKAMEEQVGKEIDAMIEQGYRAYFSSAVRKGYSGVSVFTRQKPLEVSRELGVPEFDSEGRLLRLDFDRFTLLNVYFPNGGASVERLQYKMAFYRRFLEYTDELHGEGKQVVICGDANVAHREIDLARPKANAGVSGFLPEERQWVTELLDRGFIDTYRHCNPDKAEYTWWDMVTRARDRNIGWRIDYFFVTKDLALNIKCAEIHGSIMGSDHCPIGLRLEL